MNTSRIAINGRSGQIRLVDANTIPHTDDLHPILLIAAAVINAGYHGVAVDELKLSSGRFVQHLEVDLATPEGQILQGLSAHVGSSGTLPAPNDVVALIEQQYSSDKGGPTTATAAQGAA